jgi:hypothetical protein
MTEPALKILLAAALLLACWWLWAIEYRRYRVLLLKNALFEARDALFAAAEQGKLAFDDPAYGMTRTLLNGMLRQAEALSLPHFIGMMLTRAWWSNPEVERRFNDRFSRSQARLTEAGRSAVRSAIDRSHIAIVSHVMHISFVFGLPIQLLKVWYRIGLVKATERGSQDLLESIVHSGSGRSPMQESLGTLDASAHLVGDLDTRAPLASTV